MANRYIAHYKSVGSPEEFYSEPKDNLDFLTQVTFKSKRYLLFSTILISSSTQEKNIINTAKERGIEFNVKLG
jgi:hypothetical protein